MRGYTRSGENLHIELADGRVITLQGYFADVADEPRLFISSDGVLHEVFFAEGNNGVLFAEYGQSAEWGKWSPNDALIHSGRPEVVTAEVYGAEDNEVSMLAAGLLGGGSLLGAAGAAGAAALGLAALGGGSSGGGGNGAGPVAPTVDDTSVVVGGDGADETVTVTGTGEPGDEVEVVIGGETVNTVVDDNGEWEVVFEGENFPDDGTYPVEVTVSGDGEDDVTELTGPEVVIDLTGPATAVTGGTAEAGDLINLEAHPSGLTVTGTGEVGAGVTVTIDDVTHETTVDETGGWSVDFTQDEIAGGEYTTDVTVVSEDSFGNTTTLTETVVVDTIPNDITINTAVIGAEGVVNADEAAGEVVITGTATPGAALEVAVAGLTQSVTADADGNWTTTLPSGTLAAGEYDAPITVTSTDGAGNASSVSGSFAVDTIPNDITINTGIIGGDGVVNADEATGDLAITGTATPGAVVDVTVAGVTQSVTTDASGNWGFTLAGGSFEPGEYDATITATSTDAAGNTSSVSGQVTIDTVPNDITINTAIIGGDGVVNAGEAAGDLAITGTATPGAVVDVTVAGVTQSVTTDASGNWGFTLPGGSFAAGVYDAPITATSTDAAGNTSGTASTVQIDTEVSVTLNDASIETDGVINAEERADGVQVTGTAEAGATVEVTMGTATLTTLAGADGQWSVSYSTADVPTGEVSVPINVTATDSNGNVTTTSGSVQVDSLVTPLQLDALPGGSDAVVNAEEALQGLTLTGVVEPGSSLTVTLDGVSHAATVAADGTWSVAFPASDLPSGEQSVTLDLTATDQAGNTRTETQMASFDTDAGTLTLSSEAIEGDDVINMVEASDGVVIQGTSNPGATVTVTLAGVTHTALTDAAGNWTTTYGANEIAPGTYQADITAETTDAAGNTLQVSDSVQVDTEVVNFANLDVSAGTDDVINAAEASQGVTITGTTEPGASVMVTIEGESRPGVVDANGNWSAMFEDGSITAGEYDTTVSVTSTDAVGNVAEISEPVRIDTFVNTLALTSSSAGSDGVVNIEELQSGDALQLAGQVEPGSVVSVAFNGQDYVATVAASGAWTVDIPAANVPLGEYEASFAVSATDAAGNTDTITETLQIDTEAPDGAIIESITQGVTGIRGISTQLSEDTQDVLQVSEAGVVSDVNMTAVDIPAINETNFIFAQNVPDGSDLIVSTTDDAGNSRSNYLVLDDEVVGTEVSLGNPGLGAHNVEAVDLEFAEEAHLTLSEADVLALSGASDTLTVYGDGDDQVTLTGATHLGRVTNGDGQSFAEYQLGDATVLIDEDITNVVI
ncbi:Ig-like domain-containing protein [Marinovum sp. 2_MG-2023]|uniref:beta strand repeat-containing protein n=1 Tax=unclassified Marinovum TaxID=2647166 RepID=UPI0026E1EB58|nr:MULTISPECIES: Ig-like domain-containing protein [unclassified Marinovum]MDO6730757.1 Ig-like domain-containing protein [Marinovum sp. 2_MG-2023]MDO6780038.1 Ig-like domain-containing protein [Marinovum sp. 1_MG-2023]